MVLPHENSRPYRAAGLCASLASPAEGGMQVLMDDSLVTRSMGMLMRGINGKVPSAVMIGVTGNRGHEPSAKKG